MVCKANMRRDLISDNPPERNEMGRPVPSSNQGQGRGNAQAVAFKSTGVHRMDLQRKDN